MRVEKVYQLVRQLSPSEKGQFSNFASPGTKYLALWRELVDIESLDVARLKKNLRWTSKELAMVAKYLATQILSSITKSDNSSIPVIREAILRGLPELAIQKGKSLKKKLLLEEAFFDLYQLLRLERDFDVDFKANIEITIKECFSVVSAIERLDSLNSIVKGALYAGEERRSEVVRDVQWHLAGSNEQSSDYVRVKFPYFKLLVGIELLTRSYDAAFGRQKSVIDALEEKFIHSEELYIKELATYMLMAHTLGYKYRSEELLFKLRSVEVKSRLGQIQQGKELVGKGIHIAIASGREDLAKLVLKDFQTKCHLFQGKRKANLTFYAAQLDLILGNFEDAAKKINSVFSMKRADIYERRWAYSLLQAMIHFDLGNYDFLESRKRSYLKLAKSQPGDYVVQSLKSIYSLVDSPPHSRQRVAEKFHQELFMLSKTPNGSFQNHFFNFPLWLESKAFNVPLIECYANSFEDKEARRSQGSL